MLKSTFMLCFILFVCTNNEVASWKIRQKIISQHATSRIVGGNEAVPHSAPFMVAILNTTGHHFCGGSIISRNYVLTAAHCVFGESEIVLAFGVHKWTTVESTQIRKTVKSSDIIIYPDYKSKIQVYCDLAVIRIPESISLNDNIQLISLPSSQDVNKTTYTNGRAYGWGWTESHHSEVLRYADVNFSVIGTNLIGKVENGVGICNADSGGPLVVDDIQIGINDFVNGKNCVDSLNGYVFINPFLQWINETTDVNAK